LGLRNRLVRSFALRPRFAARRQALVPFNEYVIKKCIEGVNFNFIIGDSEGQEWYDHGATDPVWKELAFWRDNLISSGDVVLECGAHHGATGIVLANYVGTSGKVISFEPLPANCEIIRKNLALNEIENVELIPAAVGEIAGRVWMTEQSNSSATREGKGHAVQAVTLDDYCSHNPTAIKLDVEGFEVKVLRGALRVLKSRPKFAIEIHPHAIVRYGDSIDELLSRVDLSGYQYWLQVDEGESPRECDLTDVPVTARCHLFGSPEG